MKDRTFRIFVLALAMLFIALFSVKAEDWVYYNIGTEGKYLTVDLDNPLPIETADELFETLATLDCTLTVYDEIDVNEYFLSILKKRKEKYIFGQGPQILGEYWYKDGLVFYLRLNEPLGGSGE